MNNYNIVKGKFVTHCCKQEFEEAFSECMTITSKSGSSIYTALTKSVYDVADIADGEAHIYCEEDRKTAIWQIKNGEIIGRYKKIKPTVLEHLGLDEDTLEERLFEDWDAEGDFEEPENKKEKVTA